MFFNKYICHTFMTVVVITLLNSYHTSAKKKPELIHINEDNWVNLLRGEWLVDFYAPWCPACKMLSPEWSKLVDWSDDLNIKVASADVTKYPGLSGRFMVSGLPTIYHVKDGKFRIYNGERKHTAMITFVEDQLWKSINPVSNFFAPNSLQMTALAYLFRGSMALRDIHNYLTDQVGIPFYLSYTIFAFCTVIVGTLLGLLIVFVVDFLSAQSLKLSAPEAKAVVKKKAEKEEGGIEDGGNEDSILNNDANQGSNIDATKRLKKI